MLGGKAEGSRRGSVLVGNGLTVSEIAEGRRARRWLEEVPELRGRPKDLEEGRYCLQLNPQA